MYNSVGNSWEDGKKVPEEVFEDGFIFKERGLVEDNMVAEDNNPLS